MLPIKLQALSNRFAKKDFLDIKTLLQNFSLDAMVKIVIEKFPQIDSGFIIHNLTNFEKADTE